ncbi:uncharacterized protein LOC135576380 isoform X2 [Columba livia]|uniref:uncharacterized protein LOC135576380 isoform X2 n=1 Tax=Columba livia TaxID=8932 RepID=UPI0031BBB2AC
MSTRTPKSFSAELLSSGSTLKLYCLLALVVSTPISPGFPPAAAVGCVLCGPLLPPALSTDPSYHFCYEGEHLTFLCMAKTMRKIGRFWFFNQTGEQIDLRSLYPLPTARLQLTATKVSAGECSYMYFMEDSGQEIPSKRSFPLTVEVQAAPVAPTFSLDPQQQVYRNRNSIKLLWSIPSCAYFVYKSARPIGSERSHLCGQAQARHKKSRRPRMQLQRASFILVTSLLGDLQSHT